MACHMHSVIAGVWSSSPTLFHGNLNPARKSPIPGPFHRPFPPYSRFMTERGRMEPHPTIFMSPVRARERAGA